MSENIDTTPILLRVPGILSLKADILPAADGQVQITGILGFALHESVHSALKFLPLGLGRQISAGLIQKQLDGNSYRFKIGQLAAIEAHVDDFGVMVLKARYPMPLARSVGHGEATRVFKRFGQALYQSGVSPSGDSIIEHFVRGFCRQDRGELDFLALFEGRSIYCQTGQTPVIGNLSISQLRLEQNTSGDLEVHFEAQGQIQPDSL